MDIRETEAFKVQQKEMLKRRAAEEISAKNIVTSMKLTENLRKEVYSQELVGEQGMLKFLVTLSTCFSLLSYTRKFYKIFPRARSFLDSSSLTRIVLIMVSARIGVTFDQYIVEHRKNPISFKNYLASYSYTESLKAKKLSQISYSRRFYLTSGLNVEKFYNAAKGLFSS